MKTAFLPLSLLVLLLFAAGPARAWSLFGSSPEAKLLQKADAAFAEAQEAAKRGDSLAELELLYSARSAYQRLSDAYPTHEADRVSQRLDATALLISAVSSSIESGESSIRDPGADAGAAEPGAPLSAPGAPDPAAPAFRTPIPVLVQTDGGSPAPAPAEAAVSDEDPSLSAAIPNPFFAAKPASGEEPVPEAAPAPGEEPAEADAPAATVALTLHEAAAPAVSPDRDLVEAREFLDMLREARATDAVLLLEDRIEEEGGAASLRTRVMYARALVQCSNFRRASDVLAALPAEAESDPSVRSLRAAVAVALDDLSGALLQLSLLLRDHPDYADAYVDIAWVYHLLDPAGNREPAIANYKAGLEHGAKRDARLEETLGVRVGR